MYKSKIQKRNKGTRGEKDEQRPVERRESDGAANIKLYINYATTCCTKYCVRSRSSSFAHEYNMSFNVCQ